jgi:class 3 adenylate cyclase
VIPFYAYDYATTSQIPGHCEYTLNVYATSALEDTYRSRAPLALCLVVASTFFFIATSFFVYDCFVQRRNSIVVDNATRSAAIVASLFPSNVRDRMMAIQEDCLHGKTSMNKRRTSQRHAEPVNGTSEERGNNDDGGVFYKSKPIADFFPATTILFGDIAGFTAWSSTRQPSEVFALLETIYNSFDAIAQQLGVYKVETIGDCYVAVVGLPTPRIDHAVVMARFARKCMVKMMTLVRKLEVRLGPDTADLSMRFGIHSGPVTAGVLRGERSRFQLFGDTMNTASRMESTGLRDRIQVSQETADLLIDAGKVRWLQPREETVVAKGKGELQTYWLSLAAVDESCNGSVTSSFYSKDHRRGSMSSLGSTHQARVGRMVQWHVETLLELILPIIAKRESESGRTDSNNIMTDIALGPFGTSQDNDAHVGRSSRFRLNRPRFRSVSGTTIVISKQIESQIYDFVDSISDMYRGTESNEVMQYCDRNMTRRRECLAYKRIRLNCACFLFACAIW